MKARESACILLLIATGCSSGTAPKSGPGIAFISGNAQTDTVQSTLQQSLTVQVTPPKGQSAVGLTVQFAGVRVIDVSSPFALYEAYVGATTEMTPVAEITAPTDNTGKASVTVTLGQIAGPARIVVKVAQLSFVDTARFTVTPGHAVSIGVSPPDTALYVGASFSPHVSTSDQFHNPRTDTPTLTMLSGPATLSAGVVTATAIGRVAFSASAGSLVDTAFVSVVPHGTIAASGGNQIYVFNTDGSGVDSINVGVLVGTVRWAPNGKSFVIDIAPYGTCGGSGGSIRTVDMTGKMTVVDTTPSIVEYPQYSRDGTWIYYTKFTYNGVGTGGPWRVHPDGTSDESLAIQNSTWAEWGSPSPDGQSLAYIGIAPGTESLRILTLSTGAVANLNVPAFSPEWSPTGAQIAYNPVFGCGSTISVINSDGTNNRLLAPLGYYPSFDWSPDGQWLVVQEEDGIDDIINVASGLVLPLHFKVGGGSPAWSPTAN